MIEDSLSKHWVDRAAAVVIDPELENWLWTDSPHVAKEIGWPDGMAALREWPLNEGFLAQGRSKPNAQRLHWKRRCGSLRSADQAPLSDLASKVSLRQCIDPAF